MGGASAEAWERWRTRMAKAKAEARLSYEEISLHLGDCNAENVRNYFKGKAKPPVEMLSRLADAVGVEPEEMLVALGLLSKQYARAVIDLASLRRERAHHLRILLHQAGTSGAAAEVVTAALGSGCAAAV